MDYFIIVDNRVKRTSYEEALKLYLRYIEDKEREDLKESADFILKNKSCAGMLFDFDNVTFFLEKEKVEETEEFEWPSAVGDVCSD